MGLGLALCILVYGLYLFAGMRQADRIDESIRVVENGFASSDRIRSTGSGVEDLHSHKTDESGSRDGE